MTTEAVALKCRHVERYEDRGGGSISVAMIVCDKPIRQRTSGPCVVACGHDADGHRERGFFDEVTEPENRPSAPVCEWCQIERLTPDETGHLHAYDPGWEHVDLEGACAVCGSEPQRVEVSPFVGPTVVRFEYMCQYQSDSPDHGPPAVELDHEARPA